ncbi:hypothetical protein FUT69_08080 [Xylella taiwanensis]|nr:hypothetical protein [Xylella taiwanensis]QKD99561.1 hypothetical protein PLS229_06820 [Xylella taiwanensis]
MSLHGGDAGVQAPPALQFHQGDGTHLQARPASGGSKTITLPNASGDLIIDAPSDRQRYVRQDGGWVAIETEPAPASDPLPDAVRARRDLLLKNSNHYMLLDVPLSEAKRTAWMQYRTALRQITSQPGFPSQVTWPAAPHP